LPHEKRRKGKKSSKSGTLSENREESPARTVPLNQETRGQSTIKVMGEKVHDQFQQKKHTYGNSQSGVDGTTPANCQRKVERKK